MAASYVAVGTAMYMITVSRCPPKKNPAANDLLPPRCALSERHLRLAQTCGMRRSSGRSGVEGGGILHCDLATQEALRRLDERAIYPRLPGLLEQGPDPGRAAAPTSETSILTVESCLSTTKKKPRASPRVL